MRKYFTKNDLLRRNWTDTLIEYFGLTPDLEKPNPYGAHRPNMKLFKKWKVLEIEATDLYQEKLEWSLGFRENMRKYKAEKRQKEQRSV